MMLGQEKTDWTPKLTTKLLELIAEGRQFKEIERAIGVGRTALYQKTFKIRREYRLRNHTQLAVAFVLNQLPWKPTKEQ
jgi:DNA-binding phage protein